jgi:polysaccharide export outer membrane protein
MNFGKLVLLVVCLFTINFLVQAQTPEPKDSQPQLKIPGVKRYKLNPGDVIEIIYRYTPEFNQTVTIQPDGFIVLEIVGELKVGGLTIEQARQEMLKKASVRLKDPEITLLLKEFQKPYFVVAGEVVQPGRFEMRENVTALQAIMLAGGFKDSAKSSQLLVFRKINSEMAEVRVLNLKSIKKTGDLENDFMLEAGDMILVPRNAISKIERFVKLASLAAFF